MTMSYQLSFFDIPGAVNFPDWHKMTIEQIALFVGEQIGIQFIPDTRYNGECNEYIAFKNKKVFYTIGIDYYDTYDKRNGQSFISVGYDNRIDHSGCGSPLDSLEEVINFFRNIESHYNKEAEEEPEHLDVTDEDIEEDEDIAI